MEKLGADICINYKASDFKERLTQETEGFVEIYYGTPFNSRQILLKLTIIQDNVGGEILDFMLTRLAKYGRVAAW